MGLDFRWFFLFVLIIVSSLLAVFYNNSKQNNSANEIAGGMDIDNSDQNINWNRYTSIDINLSESFRITKSGTYHLTGAIEDGNVTVDVGVGEVKLILDNVSIINSTGPAIMCSSADDLVIELKNNNVLKDGSTYLGDYDEDVTGVIYSKADLTFQGNGELSLMANYQDGIVGKDDVKFINGTYIIDSKDDAIRGKDSIYVINGKFVINSGADSIKSTNETSLRKGFVLIENGDFDITAKAKGLKATNNILIKGGNFALNTIDDSIHSDNILGINNGNININSGDDGIHANSELVVDGGSIIVSKAFEGLEAQKVTINNGNLSLTTHDDGINAGGGADLSTNNRPGANHFDADEKCILNINGGNIYINSAGDAIDSNGWLYINGGIISIDGPTKNDNSTLDSGLGIVINGGDIIAVGSSGMVEKINTSSTAKSVSIFLKEVKKPGTMIQIKDSENEAIFSHTSAKSFSHITIAGGGLVLGETYTVYLDDEPYMVFVVSDIITNVGTDERTF